MARSNSQTILIFLIIFIGMVIFLKTAEAQEATTKGASEEANKEAKKIANKVEYKSEKLRDPFQEEKMEIKVESQKPMEAKPLPKLDVEGVVWGSSLPQAIINNKVVRIGDTIADASIIAIDKKGVTVLFGNQQYNLTASSLGSPDKTKGGKNNPKGGKNE